MGLCLMGLGSWSPSLKAQIADRVYKTDYHIDPEKARELSVELDNISFFKDNEYTGNLPRGIRCRGFGTRQSGLLSLAEYQVGGGCPYVDLSWGE
mgnify:CR=1 FL=1